MNYSFKYETKVHVLTYEPTIPALLGILNEHVAQTDTAPQEWTVKIECIRNEPLQNMLAPANKFRWEITLRRSIK